MMEHGFNVPEADGKVMMKSGDPEYRNVHVHGFKGMQNLGSASKYIATLQFAMLLLVLAVLVGNVGMFLAKKKGAR
jgi:hypothetical protein